MRSAAIRLLLVVVIAYVAACAFLFTRQTHFLFFPEAQIANTPSDFGCEFTELWIGPRRLYAWWLPSRSASAQTIIYHHGNAGNIGSNAQHACRLNRYGFNVLVFDYRGYGRSAGDFPTEQRVYADAEDVWSYALHERKLSPAALILYGHSLGGAVATEMAFRHPEAAGLVVESTFTSIYDMARLDRTFGVFPMRFLLTEHMDSVGKIGGLKMPVLIIHGTKDAVVPSFMSQELYASAREPKTLSLIEGGHHEDSAQVEPGAYRQAIMDFSGRIGAHRPAAGMSVSP